MEFEKTLGPPTIRTSPTDILNQSTSINMLKRESNHDRGDRDISNDNYSLYCNNVDRSRDYPVWEDRFPLESQDSRRESMDNFNREYGGLPIDNFRMHSSSDREIDHLKKEINLLMQDVTKLRNDNTRLQVLSQKDNSNDNALEKALNTNVSLNMDKKKLQDTVSRLQNENYDLNQKLISKEKWNIINSELQIKLSTLERENENLKDSLNRSNDTIDKIRTENTKMEVWLQDLQTQQQNSNGIKSLNDYLADQVIFLILIKLSEMYFFYKTFIKIKIAFY